MKLISESAEETKEFGEKIGRNIGGGEVILLTGDLGGGKTQLTKGIGRGIGIKEEIISPTFTIERIYHDSLSLHHFDFYRLAHNDPELIEELAEIQKDEKNVTVIEWPENLSIQPKDFVLIKFKYLDEEKRELELEAHGEKSEALLEKL
jgi:tRNA threonylcarbamoyladenosine biosynthesis protein TsaE